MNAADIKSHARALGFDVCGIAAADSYAELDKLRVWLDAGYAGEMAYMERTADVRANVQRILPGARSVIVTGSVYNVERPYSNDIDDPGRARIARYAWGDDYHDVLHERLEALVAWMRTAVAEPFDARAFVDSGPVQERVYAQYAGLGWIGKNTCLINPELGSWLFLAEIVTTLALEPDATGFDQCGLCTLCLDACPTGALVDAHVLDARKCLSYLTIEHRGVIPFEQRHDLGSHVFGCDICQDVCPWNRLAAVSDRPEWQPRRGADGPTLADLWRRTDDEWRAELRGSAMRRAKLAGLRRNIAVAIGNSGNPDAARALDEASSDDPVVAEHVAWAKAQFPK